MPASDYLDQRVLEWALEETDMPAAPTLYVALFTAAPTKSGGGTEVSGPGYARVQTSPSDWTISGSPVQAVNSEVLFFPLATGSWGTVVAFGLFDAASGGNLLYFASAGSSIQPESGDQVVFNESQLTITGN